MTPEEIKSSFMTYAKGHLKHSLDEIVPSSSSSFKNHLNKLITEYIDKHATRFIETSTLVSDFKYENPEGFVPVDISSLNNILSNSIRMAERLSNNYIQHKQLFKQAFHKEGKDGFKPLETKNTEELSDGMDRIIYRNKVKKYANSFLRSYKHLMDDDTFHLFGRIYDGHYDRNFIQKQIRKVASFKNSDDLNNVLSKIIESEHSVDYIKHQIEENDLDAEIIFCDDDRIYVDVKDFKASQTLGSSQWCISNQEDFFNDYIHGASLALYEPTEEEDDYLFNVKKGNQIFCFNFGLDSSDPEFAIGLTISNNGDVYAAHDNDDDDVLEDFFDDAFNIHPAVFDYIKSIKKYNPDNIIEEIKELPNIPYIYEDNYLSLNYRNPLNILVKIEKQFYETNGFYSFQKHEEIPDFNFSIIRKSLHDLSIYNDISKTEMFDDIISGYSILNAINKKKEKRNKNLFLNESTNNNHIDTSQYFQCLEINDFIRGLDNMEIDVVYRNNKKTVHDIFKDFQEKFNKNTEETINHHFSNNEFFKNKFYKTMLPFVVANDAKLIVNNNYLNMIYMTDPDMKPNQKIKDIFIQNIKNESVKIEHVLNGKNWICYNDDTQKEIIKTINENNNIIKTLSNENLRVIMQYDSFNMLNENSLKTIKNNFQKSNQDISFEETINIIKSMNKERELKNKDIFISKNKPHKKLKA